jgi:hypothetical protein
MSETKSSYDVTAEEGALNWEKAGPLFDRYSVALSGQIDRVWVDCYRRITIDIPAFSRFLLEPALSRVTFIIRTSGGSAEALAAVQRLKGLLERVNREASAELAARPSSSAAATVSPRPTSSTREEAADRPAGSPAELLDRFTRH